jgi:hypothetical protein
MAARLLAIIALLVVTGSAAAAVTSKQVQGTWEAARSPEGERLYVRLLRDGKAQIIAEYDFQLPGQAGIRRGRSTAFGKWTLKKDEVVLTYGKVRDLLRYSASLPLTEIGLDGTAPGLKPVGKPHPDSRVRGAILWKAPHDYQRKNPVPTSGESSAPVAPAASD